MKLLLLIIILSCSPTKKAWRVYDKSAACCRVILESGGKKKTVDDKELWKKVTEKEIIKW